MVERSPQMEIQDVEGSTVHYSGTVGTTPIQVPPVADKIISSFWIENNFNNTPHTKTLSFSCDNGTTFTELNLGESMIWNPKGYIKQIHIKGNASDVSYKMIVNFEDFTV